MYSLNHVSVVVVGLHLVRRTPTIIRDSEGPMAKKSEFEGELDALKTILTAVGGLEQSGQRFVLRTAIERLELTDLLRSTAGSGPADGARSGEKAGDEDKTGGGREDGAPWGSGTPTAKEFLRSKRPITDEQRIVVLAYYLTHYGDQEQFKTKDLEQANIDAGGTRIKNPKVSVDNATRRAEFLTPVSGGKKKITAHGEEVVDALPDQEAVKVVLANHSPSGRKRARKVTRKRTSK